MLKGAYLHCVLNLDCPSQDQVFFSEALHVCQCCGVVAIVVVLVVLTFPPKSNLPLILAFFHSLKAITIAMQSLKWSSAHDIFDLTYTA